MIIIENKWQEEEGRRDLEDYFPEILLSLLIERSSDQIGCREFHREPKRETLTGMQSVGSCTLDRIRGWDLEKRKKKKKRKEDRPWVWTRHRARKCLTIGDLGARNMARSAKIGQIGSRAGPGAKAGPCRVNSRL